MALKVEIEYIKDPDDGERIKQTTKILAQGVYDLLKKEGLLRLDPKRQEKIKEAINKAREIINKGDTSTSLSINQE